MTRDTVIEIFRRLEKNNPAPSTELAYGSDFELLIAVMLSAQSTDVRVNQATRVLYLVANTPEKIVALGEEKLKSYIKSIGLYNTKAKHIMRTCQQLIDRHHGRVPHTRAELEALPGVGRKTANVILNSAFGQHTLAVDTHIFRVARRIGLAHGKTPRKVEDELLAVIPAEFLKHAHHWLILHGRYTCTARNPRCGDCILRSLCEYEWICSMGPPGV